MDKRYLRTQINWMDNLRLRMDWRYASAPAIFKDTGLSVEEIAAIKRELGSAEDSINRAIDVIEKAIGEDECDEKVRCVVRGRRRGTGGYSVLDDEEIGEGP